MIIYFTDRNLNILCHASTELRKGYLITDDFTTESIESGVSIFECTIYANDSDDTALQDLIETGFYVLKGKDVKTNETVTIYDSLYQIITTEYDVLEKKLKIYAEDAGLDLINTVSHAYTPTYSMMIQSYASYFMPSDWTIYNDDIGTRSLKISWEGENTLTERLLSIAGHFDAELYYAFKINNFQITEKSIHFVKKRGSTESIAQLRMNYDINNITIQKSIENIATALDVVGGAPEGSEETINLKNYTYEYIDEKGDKYEVDGTSGQMRCTTQMAKWASAIDNDGLIVKQYSFDTTDKSVLAGQARAALQKLVYPEVNYEVDIIKLPEGVKVGDKISIIADHNNIYLEARILELQTSVVNETITATIGDYLIKDSGISKYLEELAAKFAKEAKDNAILPINVEITSSDGELFTNGNVQTTMTAVVKVGNTLCTDYSELMDALKHRYSSYALDWYVDGSYVASGFTFTLTKTATTKVYAQLDLDWN